MKKTLRLITAMALATGIAAFAQDSGKDDMKQAGKDVKQAGKDTGHAAKHTAKGVKKGTKKAVNKSAKATEKGAKKVKDENRSFVLSGSRIGFHSRDFRACPRELESQNPSSRAIGRCEFPPPCGFHGEIGKILAWSG